LLARAPPPPLLFGAAEAFGGFSSPKQFSRRQDWEQISKDSPSCDQHIGLLIAIVMFFGV
jgi:hypothetical protein